MKKLLSMVLSLIMVLSLFSFASAEENVTITWWAFPTFAQDGDNPAGTYEQEVIDAFQAKHPNITVKLETIDFTSGPEKIVSAIEGGTAPDVLFDAPGRIVEYGKNGKLVKLDELFTDAFKKDVGNDALIAACGDGTNYWMYPVSSSPFYMAINYERWQETGALEFVNQEGDRAWTTEAFVNALEKLNQAGQLGGSVFCNGQGGDQGTRALVANLYSAAIANDAMTEYTMNSEAGVKGLTLIKELVDKGWLEAGTDINGGQEIELFVSGTTSLVFCWGTSAAKNNAATLEQNGITPFSLPFPSDDGVPALEYLVNGFCIFDNGDAARAEASRTFLQFLCDDEEWGPKNVVQTGAFPVRQSFGDLYAGNDEYGLLAQFTKYYAPYYNTMDGFANMRTEWWNMLQNIFTGTKDVETAVNDCVAASNAGM